ncbi:multidrug resistance protein MdtA [Sideroxyarcus emersonii]|uniref:Multidrug resistance protein MdtA n=1 Tax=Sideroxyarcus emersonii TaxID=2764705 RepID=A0AAN2BZY4_9PROT|nr:efflux RND transporter periplasmic adaptor subunit [Sideroxyarcus emersonii]BCK88282.1 multidrug resistance protein MdtA [Sideroxyarcus emersonii]
MSQYKKTIFGLLALALLAGAGYIGWQKFQGASKPEANPEQPVARAPGDTIHFAANAPQLAFLQIKDVEEYPEPLVESLNARLAYDDNHTARVYPPIAGRVLKITADAGREVKAGDELLVLDAPDYAQATADDVKAKADLQRKRQALERARELLPVNGIAQKDFESTEADFHQAEAEEQRAAARLHNLQSVASVTDGKFVLRAPVGGMISERQVNVGSEVRTDGANPLFVITDPKKLWALIDLPELYLDKVKVGQPVSVEVDAYPGEVFKARIVVIAEALDPVTRRIQVRAEIDNSANRLKPEMYARVTPVLDSHRTVPRVPNAALFTLGLHNYVFVEQGPGVLQRRRVELGLQSHEYSYVKDGLHAGERVVTTGALLLNSELSGTD